MMWYWWLMWGYWTWVVTHLLVQIYFAYLEDKKRLGNEMGKVRKYPDVSLIVAVYNEEPKILEKCLMSVAKQRYGGKMEVVLVDDGSKNIDDLRPVYKHFQTKWGFKILLSEKNQGKRESQLIATNKAQGEILVTIDCDTILLTENEINNIVRKFEDKKVGAVSGVVGVENGKVNMLTELIGYRYWSAFYLERAAQSFFGKVLCCSGPFSAYRKSVFERVKDKYLEQSFLGQKCIYGDDRHLTNLFLSEGYGVYLEPDARADTYVPENLKTYLKQQRRWSKSFYRELLWTPRVVWGEVYMVYDVIAQVVTPFLLLMVLVVSLWSDWRNLGWFLVCMVSVSMVRLAYGVYKTKDWRYLIFVLYDFLHVLLLVPNRLLALVTLKDNRWGTR